MDKLIETYKITRNSIEHFDKLLADFRKIIFAFNGIFISSGLAFFLDSSRNESSTSGIRFKVFFIVNFLLGSINILVYLLEKHYHRYLIVSAFTAKNIEKSLFNGDESKCLTCKLEYAKEYKPIPIKKSIISHITCFLYRLSKSRDMRTYDLLYLLPILGSIAVNFILAKMSKGNPCCGWLWLFSYLLLLLYVISILVIRFYNISFKNYLKESFDRLEK